MLLVLTGMPKHRTWHGRFGHTLRKHNLTWADFKKNPGRLMELDSGFYNWLTNKYEPDEPMTWYSKETTLRTLLQEGNPTFLNKLIKDGKIAKGKNFILIITTNYYVFFYRYPRRYST